MGRLRHPVRAIREPLGTAGLVVAIIALIMAMGGAAFAAAGLNGKQKKEVEKIAKKFAGAPGKQGAPGANGAQGPVGAQGSTGPTGVAGAKGDPGANGAQGSPGKQGESAPCTAGEPTCVVASGVTETGAWSISQSSAGALQPFATISFPIPLAEGSGINSAFAFNKEQTANEDFGTSGCEGSVAEPTAPSGKLCVYTGGETLEKAAGATYQVQALEVLTTSKYAATGAVLRAPFLIGSPEEPASIEASGSWAVTAP